MGTMCDCLPGLCTCGKQHYLFKKEKKSEDFGMGFSKEQAYKTESSPKGDLEPFKKGFGQDSRQFFVSEDSSCSCIHPVEEAQVTPIVSRVEVVALPPPQITKPQIGKKIRLVRCTEPKYQKTLVIVKPEAVRYKDVIFRAIHKEGLDIVNERLVHLTPEQVAEIYSENFGSAYFPLFVQQLSSSPILVLTIAGRNVVQRWKSVVGPDKGIPMSWFYPASMRRRFSVNEDIHDAMKLSDEFQKAKTEIRYFFPFNIIDPIIISSTMVQDYCDEFIHPTLLKGLFRLVKTKPADPIRFLAEWLLINNPFQPFYMQREVSLAAT